MLLSIFPGTYLLNFLQFYITKLRSSLNAQSLIFQEKLYVSSSCCLCGFMYFEVQTEVKYDSCSCVRGLRDVVYRYLKVSRVDDTIIDA